MGISKKTSPLKHNALAPQKQQSISSTKKDPKAATPICSSSSQIKKQPQIKNTTFKSVSGTSESEKLSILPNKTAEKTSAPSVLSKKTLPTLPNQAKIPSQAIK